MQFLPVQLLHNNSTQNSLTAVNISRSFSRYSPLRSFSFSGTSWNTASTMFSKVHFLELSLTGSNSEKMAIGSVGRLTDWLTVDSFIFVLKEVDKCVRMYYLYTLWSVKKVPIYFEPHFHVFWWIFTVLLPMETGMNDLYNFAPSYIYHRLVWSKTT